MRHFRDWFPIDITTIYVVYEDVQEINQHISTVQVFFFYLYTYILSIFKFNFVQCIFLQILKWVEMSFTFGSMIIWK